MRKVLICIFLFLATNLNAQTIHGHPQKSSYKDSSEYPTFSVPQCHWRSETLPMLGHTHLDLKAPYYSELIGAIVADFTITLYHINGQASFGDRLEGARDVIWDATESSTSPELIGDPMGIVVFTGHVTLDPTMQTRWFTPQGWWSPILQVVTYFNGGDTVVNQLVTPFYSMLDPTKPESNGAPQFFASCIPIDSTHPEIIWGNNFVQTNDYLPIAPISAPWTMFINTAGYGAQGLPPAVFQQRLDLDLHHGIPGTIIEQITHDGDINTNVTLDPVVMGPGLHKVAIFRNQQSLDGAAEVNTLFVFPVTVGDSIPPVQVCTDPLATNVGQPLPCTYPVLPIWSLGTVFWHDKIFELCPGNNPNDLACVIQ